MFHFVANLKPYNVYRGRGNDRFDAYLLSVDYYKQHKKLSDVVIEDKRVLCADNGNVDLIVKTIGAHSKQAKALHKDRRKEEKVLGRNARPGELSNALEKRYREFSQALLKAQKKKPSDAHIRQVLQVQNNMSPTYIVGMEDFTIVALTALNIERQYSKTPVSWFRKPIDRALELAVDTKQGKFGQIDAKIFAGLHAIDFDTAVQAGTMAAEADVDGIATGLVSSMKDSGYSDFRIENDRIVEFGDNLPRPYIRTMEIIAGMHLGYRETCGKRLAFHGLGVGTPILLPMVGLLSRRRGFTAIDSTAPIKDAYSSRNISLYVDTPAPRKLKAHKIIQYWLSQNYGWTCTCPYCRRFNKAHPPQVDKAKRWWKSEGERKIEASDLRNPSPLAEFFPLLCSSQDKAIRRFAGQSRIGHNHWVLIRLEQKVQELSRNPRQLRNWVDQQLSIYLNLKGSSKHWQKAAEQAWKITREAQRHL